MLCICKFRLFVFFLFFLLFHRMLSEKDINYVRRCLGHSIKKKNKFHFCFGEVIYTAGWTENIECNELNVPLSKHMSTWVNSLISCIQYNSVHAMHYRLQSTNTRPHFNFLFRQFGYRDVVLLYTEMYTDVYVIHTLSKQSLSPIWAAMALQSTVVCCMGSCIRIERLCDWRQLNSISAQCFAVSLRRY